ncbi:carbamoyltransferase HypF [Candidatus Fermentibacteria bacterium]|nr:carbamoyltransferase HypF [Candidatus Fermentibacteria bacterium]
MVRRTLMVRGVVQGVGFRPTVYRCALSRRVAGWVRNRSDGLEIAVEGDERTVAGFIRDVIDHPPPCARVTAVEIEDAEPVGEEGFTILPSLTVAGNTLCPADLATCDACFGELFDPRDRRFRYPFINCTDCGPRFSAVVTLPYDRPSTSMACFPMCPLCSAEYHDPLNRRYHAQPNACAECGPKVWLVDGAGQPLVSDDPVGTLASMLRQGFLAAIKGIGGFHLAADATDEASVARLRRRKGRDAKPLAVMVADLEWGRRCGVIDDQAEAILVSPARPIVVVDAVMDGPLAPSIAPGIGTVGIMLPYSPIHHLLFRDRAQTLPPLVMTSGNLSDEPIAIGNREAIGRLGRCADIMLLHDRDIVARADDSVMQHHRHGAVFIRRSRGHVPEPLPLPSDMPPSLGTGAYLKATPCLVSGRQAFLGQHVGDLSTLEGVRFHALAIDALESLMRITPEAIGCDLNPDFPSSVWARRHCMRVEPVQHHHAHVVAAGLDHGLEPPLLGLAIDGTGLGTDGSIWGCELVLADRVDFKRLGHLLPLPLPGGDAAVHETWRVAIGLLHACFGEAAQGLLEQVLCGVDIAHKRLVLEAVHRGAHTPMQTSCGRLFDAAAALTGVCTVARFEAEAAMMLERAAGFGAYRHAKARPFPMGMLEDAPLVLDPRPMVRELTGRLLAGDGPEILARRFHDTMVHGLSGMVIRCASGAGFDTVVLTGGCMLNRYLADGLTREMERAGLRALVPRRIPVGDGGISLGQAAVAGWRLSTDEVDRVRDSVGAEQVRNRAHAG